MDNVNFDINEALKLYMSDPATIPTPEADASLFECENDPESLTNSVINPILNPIIDAVAENPDAITRSAYFDSLQLLLKCAPTSPCPSNIASGLSSSVCAQEKRQIPTPEPTPPPNTSLDAPTSSISSL